LALRLRSSYDRNPPPRGQARIVIEGQHLPAAAVREQVYGIERRHGRED
jgi:hypothetical protein